MKKELIILGQKISYIVKKYRRAKNLRLLINSRGELIATKPWFVSEKAIKEFIISKAQWVLEKMKHFRDQNDSNQIVDSREEYLKHRAQAEQIIYKKINEFNQHYRYRFSKISIRNQRTKWGSCSSHGSLSFNYRIVFLPEPMINYVVVHELCHLKELNHSARFWSLVAQQIPNYQQLRKDLQKIGIRLR